MMNNLFIKVAFLRSKLNVKNSQEVAGVVALKKFLTENQWYDLDSNIKPLLKLTTNASQHINNTL